MVRFDSMMKLLVSRTLAENPTLVNPRSSTVMTLALFAAVRRCMMMFRLTLTIMVLTTYASSRLPDRLSWLFSNNVGLRSLMVVVLGQISCASMPTKLGAQSVVSIACALNRLLKISTVASTSGMLNTQLNALIRTDGKTPRSMTFTLQIFFGMKPQGPMNSMKFVFTTE